MVHLSTCPSICQSSWLYRSVTTGLLISNTWRILPLSHEPLDAFPVMQLTSYVCLHCVLFKRATISGASQKSTVKDMRSLESPSALWHHADDGDF